MSRRAEVTVGTPTETEPVEAKVEVKKGTVHQLGAVLSGTATLRQVPVKQKENR